MENTPAPLSSPDVVVYDTAKTWTEFGQSTLTTVFDLTFDWVNEVIEGQKSLEERRVKNLSDDPNLNIKDLDDGYNLEAERLNAIQQKGSKGFQVVDINPGLLNKLDYVVNLPYEFLFDGTNFLPATNESITENFRTVNIPLAGNFLKIEFINEVNSYANAVNSTGKYRPYADRKYKQALLGTNNNELDLTTGQSNYSFDNFARNKVWIDFGPSSGKPHIVPTSGRVFETYFSEVNITLNIGSPKIRITIGYNSKVVDASNVSAINAKLCLTGAGRMLADSDMTMSPFYLSDMDLPGSTANGYTVATSAINTTYSYAILQNYAQFFYTGYSPDLGYSVIWITNITVNKEVQNTTIPSYARCYLYISNGLGQTKRVANFKLGNNINVYTISPSEPIRVVIPANWTLLISFETRSDSANFMDLSWNITGYSIGEILTPVLSVIPVTSKFITDATFLSDYNMIDTMKDL